MAKHPHRQLSGKTLSTFTTPGRYGDGNGLHLVVDHRGRQHWILRTMVQGRRTDMGLGSVRNVSLAEAREAADRFRRQAKKGDDPILARKQASRKTLTFEHAARIVHEQHSPSWRNPKHRQQWLNTLQQYAFPVFGHLPIDKVHSAHVLQALGPIWLRKPETARRVRQRIGAVLDWSKAAGHRSGDSPVDGAVIGLPKQTDQVEHHKAMPYAEVPTFLRELRTFSASAPIRCALEFAVLTAARTGEVLGARWTEIDQRERTWTIPGSRMKARVEHRVPLSPRCMEILEETRESASGEHVFSVGGDQPLSNMTMMMMMRRMDYTGVTVHGFRSAFRDWSAEKTSFAREVCEAALAHRIENAVEAAYRRSDLFEKRRALMDTWSQFCTQTTAKVVKLRSR